MDALFTAMDISALQTNVTTALTVGVVLGLSFLAFRYIKKIFGKV